MRPENARYLEDNRDCYDEVVRVETAGKAMLIQHELLRIMREEFFPDYIYTGGCGDCLFTLVRTLYRYYDDWKSRQPVVVEANFPKHEKKKGKV